MSATTTFTITYSQNWDGGKQEYNTALTALRRVFPDADLIENCVNKFPIRVVISAENYEKIWAGPQQDLFSKYADRRTEAMADIEASLEEYKDINTSSKL